MLVRSYSGTAVCVYMYCTIRLSRVARACERARGAGAPARRGRRTGAFDSTSVVVTVLYVLVRATFHAVWGERSLLERARMRAVLVRGVSGHAARGDWPSAVVVLWCTSLSTRPLFGLRELSCWAMSATGAYGNGHREVRYMQELCAGAQYASTAGLRLAGRRPDGPRGQRVAAPTDGVEACRRGASALGGRLSRDCVG